MRLVFKIVALPFVLVTGILYLVCKFLVITSGAVLGILSGIVFWRRWFCSLLPACGRGFHGW